MANRESNTATSERKSEKRIRCEMSDDLRAARDIAIQALASNARNDDPDEVLDFAFEQLGSHLRTLQAACRDGLRWEDLDAELIRKQEYIEALSKFVRAFLHVEFKGAANV